MRLSTSCMSTNQKQERPHCILIRLISKNN